MCGSPRRQAYAGRQRLAPGLGPVPRERTARLKFEAAQFLESPAPLRWWHAPAARVRIDRHGLRGEGHAKRPGAIAQPQKSSDESPPVLSPGITRDGRPALPLAAFQVFPDGVAPCMRHAGTLAGWEAVPTGLDALTDPLVAPGPDAAVGAAAPAPWPSARRWGRREPGLAPGLARCPVRQERRAPCGLRPRAGQARPRTLAAARTSPHGGDHWPKTQSKRQRSALPRPPPKVSERARGVPPWPPPACRRVGFRSRSRMPLRG